jgi:hypothetical protein
MTNTSKLVLIRGLKALGAVVIAGLATWVASPDVLNLVPTSYQFFITAVGVPALLAAEKYLKVQKTARQNPTPTPVVTPTPAPPAPVVPPAPPTA